MRLTLPAVLSLALGCSGSEIMSAVEIEPETPARSRASWLDDGEGCKETGLSKKTPRLELPKPKPAAACDGSESESAGASLAASVP